jgi:hypothetical protein
MCRSRVESIAEWSNFAEVRNAEIEADAIYQTGNVDDCKEMQVAFKIHVLSEAGDQPG